MQDVVLGQCMPALRVTLVRLIVWDTDHTGTGEVGPVRSADGTASSRNLSVQASTSGSRMGRTTCAAGGA